MWYSEVSTDNKDLKQKRKEIITICYLSDDG